MVKISIEDYFLKRLISGVRQAQSENQSAEHGESPEWNHLSRGMAEFLHQVDPEMSYSQFLFQTVWAAALVETISAIAQELGVTELENPVD